MTLIWGSDEGLQQIYKLRLTLSREYNVRSLSELQR
jgi:hypothetical protein